MHASTLIAVVIAPLTALAAPSLQARQGLVQPAPCVHEDPEPSVEILKERFNAFAEAFLVDKNLTAAFSFIDDIYINHNPMASDGPDAAFNVLGPIWSGLSIDVLRTAFDAPFGWLNYQVSGLGTVVDRYRFEGGCITEHWDQGEQFPEGLD